MDVDDVGLGSGVMAAAARIKSAPEGGVQIDDYAEEPIRLVTVARKLGLLAIRVSSRQALADRLTVHGES